MSCILWCIQYVLIVGRAQGLDSVPMPLPPYRPQLKHSNTRRAKKGYEESQHVRPVFASDMEEVTSLCVLENHGITTESPQQMAAPETERPTVALPE